MNIITMNYDFDGFLFDFEPHFINRFGVDSSNMESAEICRLIGSVPDFYYTMPVMEGAHEFLFMATTRQPPPGYAFYHRVLTACPISCFEMAAIQKKRALQKHFGNMAMTPVPGSAAKHFYVQRPGDLLVDDYGKNCSEWNEAGGVAIKHNDFDHTHQKFFEFVMRATA